jgi:hypothetical protein
VNRRKDGITGYVAGGLGNQLFILAAAWEQSRRLGCPLYLDRSHFGAAGTWGYQLDVLDTPASVLPASESWRSLRLNKERVLPVPTRVGRVFLERDGDTYTPEIERIRPGTTLVGYFQSGRYFPSVRDEMIGAMLAQPETAAEQDLLAAMRAEPAITLHLRRGDYLAVSADRQFIASVDYAVRAIELLKRMGLGLPIRVFSDSVELVRSELAGVDADIRVVEDDGVLGNWATLKAMAAGQAMIMSNSSFSWWAAALMRSTGDPAAAVVAPRPWTRGGTAKADMLEPDWVTLDAR